MNVVLYQTQSSHGLMGVKANGCSIIRHASYQLSTIPLQPRCPPTMLGTWLKSWECIV